MAQGFRANIRIHLRFAAVLLAALAASLSIPVAGLALNVALFAASGAAAALSLAFGFPRGAPPWFSGAVLTFGFAVGLAASLAAQPVLALAFQGTAAATILAASFLRFSESRPPAMVGILSALSLLLGALALMDGAPGPSALFFAAALGLTTRALQLPVTKADARIKLPVGGQRA